MAQPSRALLLRRPCFRAQRLSCWAVPQALNKTEFVAAVKESVKQTPAVTALSNPDFERIVFGVFDTITDRVAKGESVIITGFGKFERRERKARTGRNPQTQETLEIAATVTPGFTPGKSFKATVKAGDTGGAAAGAGATTGAAAKTGSKRGAAAGAAAAAPKKAESSEKPPLRFQKHI
ncbi:hypothetical protein ABBQ32_006683 [Trebouxia sp. C0010 RCD-2024]